MIKQIEMMLGQLKNQLSPEVGGDQGDDHVMETPSIIVDRRKRLVVQEGEPVQLSAPWNLICWITWPPIMTGWSAPAS